MIKILAPDHAQLTFRFRAVVAIAQIHDLPTGLHPTLQITKDFLGADDRIPLSEEHGAAMFEQVLFPQYVLGPEECAGESMCDADVLGSEVPE